MPEQMVKMIQEFIEWVPDVDILFNENDECRLVIPWAEKQELLRREEAARSVIGRVYNNRYPPVQWLGTPTQTHLFPPRTVVDSWR
jgi:hypothetical protein